MVGSRRIDEIQHAVVNPQVVGEGVAAEVHDGGDRAFLYVDTHESVEAVVDEEGVELFPSLVNQHILFPAAVGHHLAVPFADFVEGEGIAL